MSARQPSMGQFHLGRIIFSLLTFGLLALGGCAQHQPFPGWPLPEEVWPQPTVKLLPATPILRIEPGEHTAVVTGIDTDAAGRVLVTGSMDKTVRVWSLPEGRLLNTLRLPIVAGNEGEVYALAISPDGTTVAVGGWTGYKWDRSVSIYLFNRLSNQIVRRLTGLPNPISKLAYSQDGRYLAASLVGKTGIRIYRTNDWQLVAEDRDYRDSSSSVDFATDGRLVNTSYDGFIRLYGPDFKLLVKRETSGGQGNRIKIFMRSIT